MPGPAQVRAAAEIDPVALPVHRDDVVGGQFHHPLGLEALALVGKKLGNVVAAPYFAHDRHVTVDDVAHARLDDLEIVRRERFCAVEVIIEAIIRRWPEGNLRTGEQFLHGHREHVRAVMAQHVERGSLVLVGDDGDRGVFADGSVEIPQFAIDTDDQRRFGEAWPDRCSDVGARDRVVIAADGTVRKGDRDHGLSLIGQVLGQKTNLRGR